MKPLFALFLSTVAICAFVSATPVVAQETITGAPRGEAPITAEPPITLSPGPGIGYAYNGPLSAAERIFDGIASSSADTAQPGAGRHVTADEYRGVP
jgi:hypothetical protein